LARLGGPVSVVPTMRPPSRADCDVHHPIEIELFQLSPGIQFVMPGRDEIGRCGKITRAERRGVGTALTTISH
jgi:hypothetical protein